MNFNGELFFGVNLTYSGNFTINGNVTVNGTALFADGKAGAPSIAFTNETSLGFYRNALGEVTFTGSRLILDGDLQITQDLIIDGDVTLNGDLKCEDLTCQSITNSGTASNGTNAQTTGALSTTSISNSGTQSNGTNAQTTGALSTTSISNSGTQSNGTNAQTTGALSCTSITSSGTAQVTNIASTSGSNVSGTFYTFASDVGSSLNSFANFHVTATGLATTAGGGMGVEVVGRNGAYIGVCRSNASLGQLPASTAYFTSGSNSNVSIGRGSGNLASTADILIGSTGTVAMTNGQVSVASISIASTSGTTSQTRALFLGTTNSQSITSGTTAQTVTVWSTTASTTRGLAVTCNGTTFTVPSTGNYTVEPLVYCDTDIQSLYFMIQVNKAGDSTLRGTKIVTPVTNGTQVLSTAVNIDLAASGTFTIEVAQVNTGGAKNIGGATNGPKMYVVVNKNL